MTICVHPDKASLTSIKTTMKLINECYVPKLFWIHMDCFICQRFLVKCFKKSFLWEIIIMNNEESFINIVE